MSTTEEKYEAVLKNFANCGLKQVPTKNPVSLLYEICAKLKLEPPTFELVEQTGTPNNPKFFIKCILGNTEYIGISRCKQQARHNSALEAIKKITELNNDTEILKSYIEIAVVPEEPDEEEVKKPPVKKEETEEHPYDPICELKQLALMCQVEATFEYETLAQASFRCRASFGDFLFEEAHGTNKKSAKKTAANKLLESIKNHEKIQDILSKIPKEKFKKPTLKPKILYRINNSVHSSALKILHPDLKTTDLNLELFLALMNEHNLEYKTSTNENSKDFFFIEIIASPALVACALDMETAIHCVLYVLRHKIMEYKEANRH